MHIKCILLWCTYMGINIITSVTKKKLLNQSGKNLDILSNFQMCGQICVNCEQHKTPAKYFKCGKLVFYIFLLYLPKYDDGESLRKCTISSIKTISRKSLKHWHVAVQTAMIQHSRGTTFHQTQHGRPCCVSFMSNDEQDWKFCKILKDCHLLCN